VGFVLVAARLVAAYWWRYKLAPLPRLADPAWLCGSFRGSAVGGKAKGLQTIGKFTGLVFSR
jgi:hypothetical protein